MRALTLFWGILWRTTWTYGIFQSVLLWATYSFFGANESLFKLKATFTGWAFAALLLIALTIFRRTPIELMLGSRLQLTTEMWRAINYAVIVIFIVLGGLNWTIAASTSTDTWLSFRLFWGPGIYLSFAACLAGWVRYYEIDRSALE